MMKPRTLAALLLLSVGLGVQTVSPGCERAEECEAVDGSVDGSPPASTAVLPTWAVGNFGRHAIDVSNLRIEASGVAYRLFDGGDSSSGCPVLAAAFVDGRVRLSQDGEASEDLVKTTSGRFFVGPAGAPEAACGWDEFQATALCGREVGGCGGFASAVSCTWEEAAAGRCTEGGDDGGPAGE